MSVINFVMHVLCLFTKLVRRVLSTIRPVMA